MDEDNIMATLALTNGKRYDIKEHVTIIDTRVMENTRFVKLTLIKKDFNSDRVIEENARFMINAIAYWY